MTILNLAPLGIAAVVPLGGDESDVVVKRWVLKTLLPVFIVGIGFVYSAIDRRFVKLETAPTSELSIDRLDNRVKSIEKLIDLYETLRVTREQQIAAMQANGKNMERRLDEMNAKLDRLLTGRRPGRN